MSEQVHELLQKKYSIDEASPIARRSKIKLYDDVKKGRIRHLRIGSRIYFTEQMLVEYLQNAVVDPVGVEDESELF